MVTNDIDKQRWKMLTGAVVFLVAFLSVGLIWLQVVRGRELAEDAAVNSVRKLAIPAPRGEMYDTNGEVLVNNVSGYVINLAYMGQEENEEVITKIADILLKQKLQEDFAAYLELLSEEDDSFGLSSEDEAALFEQFVAENEAATRQELIDNMMELTEDKRYYRRYEPVKLAPIQRATVRQVDIDIVAKIEENRHQLPNVMIEVEPLRQYKIGNYAFHTLGGINTIDRVGREGLELSLDEHLAGDDGAKIVEVNAFGRPTSILGTRDPVPGANVHLTLDMRIQMVAEDALQASMKRIREQAIAEARQKGQPTPDITKLAHSGAVVVLDAKTGGVLAMASAPEADRQNYQGMWDAEDPFVARFQPGVNHATGMARAPGSTFKPITAIAALEKDLVTLDDKYYCDGRYNGLYNSWRNFTLHCWRVHGGPQNVIHGLKNSCNLVFYPLGQLLGLDTLAEYYEKFGFGVSTGFTDIESGTAMSKGRVWDSAKFQEVFDFKPQPADLAQAGIGQGEVRATPLQVAMYTAMLANAELQDDEHYVAKRMRPYVVDKVISHEGELLYSAQPEALSEITIEKDALDITREGMRQVTEAPTGPTGLPGTAYWQFHRTNWSIGKTEGILPFEVTGKTGTAQEYGWENHGWFISYAPYDDPEIVVCTLVEQGLSGGGSGGPIALEIYKEYFGLNEADEEETP